MVQKASIPQDTVCFLHHATQLILGRNSEVSSPDPKKASKCLQIFSTLKLSLLNISKFSLKTLFHILQKLLVFQWSLSFSAPTSNNCIGSNMSTWEVTNHKLPTIYQITLVVQSLTCGLWHCSARRWTGYVLSKHQESITLLTCITTRQPKSSTSTLWKLRSHKVTTHFVFSSFSEELYQNLLSVIVAMLFFLKKPSTVYFCMHWLSTKLWP
jgi:hypothetical protein